MSDRTFVDTNILVYAHDVDDRSKHALARDALRALWNDGTGVLSPQVLQEFYVNVTRKIATPLRKNAARTIVSTYAIWCIDISSADVAAAFRIEDEAKIGFWDALILGGEGGRLAVAVGGSQRGTDDRRRPNREPVRGIGGRARSFSPRRDLNA
jgi:predicted nucleic acid-binding protein